MTKLNPEIFDDVITVINKIRNLKENEVELEIPEGSVLFDNILNLKLIKQQAEQFNISVEFNTKDENGMALIEMLEGSTERVFTLHEEENASLSETPAEHRKLTLPKIKFPSLNFSLKGKSFIIPITILGVLGLFLFLISKAPKANIKLLLKSQSLTRSITIKVGSDLQTNPEAKTLKGSVITGDAQADMEAETTGTKTVGVKAKGEITVYNKTDNKIKLKKNTVVNYKDGISYVIDSDTEVPARTEQATSDPTTQVFQSGETDTKVTAADIGPSYNIDDNKGLTIKGYKSSEMTAETKGKISGGKSEQVKVVSLEDQKALSAKMLEQNKTTAENFLKGKLGATQKLIEGSVQATITKETFSADVNEEADKLTLTQTVAAKGLVYLSGDLDSVLKTNQSKLIPEGYSLAQQDWAVSIEVLNSSENAVSKAKEADLQVTLKASIIPSLDKEELKKKLAGKAVDEAEKIVGSLESVKTYSISVSPTIPLLTKIPTDFSRILIDIENE